MQVLKDRTVTEYQIDPLALQLEPTDAVDERRDEIKQTTAIVLDFSTLADGRAYSLARQLRDRLAYSGDIVALGVRKDNAAMIEQCGANVLVPLDKYDASDLLPFLDEITTQYQPNYNTVNA